jgi:hypothetical protein
MKNLCLVLLLSLTACQAVDVAAQAVNIFDLVWKGADAADKAVRK